ncbi:MAG TPA: DUF3047 domain-containing protein [Fibrobacteraceae bacterium]|nr:DUF3047 domain-containing protein [Fibrobacteraceae bacterium]
MTMISLSRVFLNSILMMTGLICAQTIPCDSLQPVRCAPEKSYYQILKNPGSCIIHAEYIPEQPTVTLGWKADKQIGMTHVLQWKWRVLRYPQGADERVEGRGDSPAAVYCLFSKGLRTYALKYVYSTIVPTGTNFSDPGPNPFHRQWLIVLRSQSPGDLGKWKTEQVDFKKDFQNYFGFPAPALKGIGLMTDGDGTMSKVSAEYSEFRFVP